MARLEMRGRFLPTLLVFLATLTSCSVGVPLGPESQVEVTKETDDFLLRAWYMENGTTTLTYSWGNTGTQATVDITQFISSGSVILIIKDDVGTVVHQDDIANDNDTDTAVGVAGDWEVELRFQNATGSFDLSIRKKT